MRRLEIPRSDQCERHVVFHRDDDESWERELWKQRFTPPWHGPRERILLEEHPARRRLVLAGVNGTLFFAAAFSPACGRELGRNDGTLRRRDCSDQREIAANSARLEVKSGLTQNVNGTLFASRRTISMSAGVELWSVTAPPLEPWCRGPVPRVAVHDSTPQSPAALIRRPRCSLCCGRRGCGFGDRRHNGKHRRSFNAR